jgi:predicted dehydrogenase
LSNISLDTKTALSFTGLFSNEINHLISCIKGETECKSPSKDGVMIMAILDAIYEAARTVYEVMIDM